MDRLKTYDATGIAPNGKLYAGDLNLLQDTVAALADFTKTFQIGTVQVGDSGLAISKFGTGELTLSAAIRISGILRANGGMMPLNCTTTTRDAISSPPTGLMIYNTTNGRPEIYNGSTWIAFGFIPNNGTNITNADVNASAAIAYSKLALGSSILNADISGSAAIAYSKLNLTGNIVNADISASAAIGISKLAGYPSDGTKTLMGDGSWIIPILVLNSQGASYTAVLSDGNKLVEINNSSANTFTIPPNASVAFPIGTTITISQTGTGQTTITPGSGVTLRAYNNNLKLAGQYAMASVVKRATNEWSVAGNLVP